MSAYSKFCQSWKLSSLNIVNVISRSESRSPISIFLWIKIAKEALAMKPRYKIPLRKAACVAPIGIHHSVSSNSIPIHIRKWDAEKIIKGTKLNIASRYRTRAARGCALKTPGVERALVWNTRRTKINTGYRMYKTIFAEKFKNQFHIIRAFCVIWNKRWPWRNGRGGGFLFCANRLFALGEYNSVNTFLEYLNDYTNTFLKMYFKPIFK